LIVTADDFGAADEVNEAVEAAHRRGILSAASLMVGAAASADAVRRARLMPTLRVGLHVVLVDGRPTLPSSAIPLLVDHRGWLRSDLVSLGCLLARSSQARRQLAAEISAQFEAYRATGLGLDHCNAHKHFHLHPVVSRLLVSIGARFGLRAIRVPSESRRLLARIEPNDRGFPSITTPFASLLRRQIRAAGLCATDQVFGLQWSGHMTKHRLLNLIRHLPTGLSEIYLHPATGPFEGHAPGYRYRDELEALLDPEVLAAARLVKVGGFGDFMTQEAPTHAIT
jgi:chitin disaccharide deacetylase